MTNKELASRIPYIKVFGIGGSGINILNDMISSSLHGVEFIAVDTDKQFLTNANATIKIHIKENIPSINTEFIKNPLISKRIKESYRNQILNLLGQEDIIFIVTGIGGITGTNISPIIADIVKERDAISIAIVTNYSIQENQNSYLLSDMSISRLQKKVDAIIRLPDTQIVRIVNSESPKKEVLTIVNNIIVQFFQGVFSLFYSINDNSKILDNIKSALKVSGESLFGIGNAFGINAIVYAINDAISSGESLKGANKVLINIASKDGELSEYVCDEGKSLIQAASGVDRDDILFTSTIDESLGNKVRAFVWATAFNHDSQ